MEKVGLYFLIDSYYRIRGLKRPNVWEALAWLTTEQGEVYELLMARSGGWVRNNPEDKEQFTSEKLAEELGDIIMMCVAAGIAEGVDPLAALEAKIERKLEQHLLVHPKDISKYIKPEGEQHGCGECGVECCCGSVDVLEPK